MVILCRVHHTPSTAQEGLPSPWLGFPEQSLVKGLVSATSVSLLPHPPSHRGSLPVPIKITLADMDSALSPALGGPSPC